MSKLLGFIKSIINRPVIVCPCGYKTHNIKKAKHHLMTAHPEGTGVLDFNSDAIVWG